MATKIFKTILLYGFVSYINGQFTFEETTMETTETSTSQPCGFNLITDGGELTLLESRNYPYAYPYNQDCVWLIETTHSDLVIEAQFGNAVRLTNGDMLEFRDGPHSTSPLLHRFTGVTPNPSSFESTSRYMRVHFISASNYEQQNGFSMYLYTKTRPTIETTEGTTESAEPTTEPTTMFLSTETETTDPPWIPCNQSFYQDSGEFMSPYYPSNYYNNADCYYTFEGSPGAAIQVYFFGGFFTEIGYDYLEFRDGPNSNSPLIIRLTGEIQRPEPIISSSNYMTAWFHTDGSVTFKGFLAYFYTGYTHPTTEEVPTTQSLETTFSPPFNCGNDLDGYYGEFESPNYPFYYPYNLDCVWLITGAEDMVEVFFLSGSVSLTEFDFLEFRDGPDSNSSLLRTYTGVTNNPGVLFSTSRYLRVRFFSSQYYGQAQKTGFNAFFYSSTPSTSEPEFPSTYVTDPPHLCNQSFFQDFGHFHSPNYPLNYPNNVDCVYTFQVSPGNTIFVHFDDYFETESYDFLEFRDGPFQNSPFIAKLNGSIGYPNSIATTSNYLWAWFHSDSTKTNRGFSALFSLARYATTMQPPVTDHPATDPPASEQPVPSSTTFKPARTTTRTTATPVIGNPGIVINNNNNMYVNFFDLANKLQSWLSTFKPLGNLTSGNPEH